MSKKKPPKVTVRAGRITGSVIIKGPTRAELLQEEIDALVLRYPNMGGTRLWQIWSGSKRTPLEEAEFFSMLRWPAGAKKR